MRVIKRKNREKTEKNRERKKVTERKKSRVKKWVKERERETETERERERDREKQGRKEHWNWTSLKKFNKKINARSYASCKQNSAYFKLFKWVWHYN